MSTIYSFFFGKHVENPDFLVFFRISVGIILCIHLLSLGTDFDTLYGINKSLPTDIQTYNIHTPILYYDDIIYHISNWFEISTQTSERWYYLLYCMLCVFLISGFFSRASALVLLILQIGWIKSSHFYAYGVDFFCSMSLFYLVLLPSDNYFSLKNALFKNINPTENLTPFRRLMQIHLSWAYGISGLEKLLGYNWRNGESIWKAMHLPSFNNPFVEVINYLGQFTWLFVISGWLVIFIELLYPLFINIRKTRKIWLFITILMHIFIALTLNLYFFSSIMIVWNITNFYFEDKTKKEYI